MSAEPADTADPTPAFNLLDEAWIPVRRIDGRLDEVGLLELFRQANQIEGLAETSPPSFVALHRLLLAIVHRALTAGVGRWSTGDRVRWYREGLPAQTLVDYLERWRERFWLFHPSQPFMQVAALESAPETTQKFKPWTTLSMAAASGDNPVVFDHNSDCTATPIAASEAIRHLLGLLQFTPGGLIQVLRTADFAGPLANAIAVIPAGKTLCETLTLGLHPCSSEDSDIPSWERSPADIKTLCAPPTLSPGPIDRYTRQTRAVLFRREPTATDIEVLLIRYAAGIALRDDPNDLDPATPHYVGKLGPRPVRFADGRAFWRDLPALLPSQDIAHRQSIAPKCMTWAYNLLDQISSDANVDFIVAGVSSGAKPAKMARWRMERHSVPSGALTGADSSAMLRLHLARSERLYFSLLGLAAQMLAMSRPPPDAKTQRKRQAAWKRAEQGEDADEALMTSLDRERCAAAFFGSAGRSLPSLLDKVANGDIESAHAMWSAALLRSAQVAWQAAGDVLGESAAALRARARMHGRFQQLIRPLRPADAGAAAPSNPHEAELTP
jgi:CRISPR system Cascade subunit CasA